MRSGKLTAVLSSIFFITFAHADSPRPLPGNFFPFYTPWNDVTPGTATDLSFLNDKPAGKNGRIVVRDGHFAEENTGRRIRFFATSVTAIDAFPTNRSDADQYAAALAKRGINLVRLHHLDNPWAVDTGGSLWAPGSKDHQHIDPKQLDKLDYLIAQFIKNGIYVNLNMKVSKTLTAADGFPPSIAQIPYPLQKRVDYFDPKMVEQQKNIARQFLTHRNPYTGRTYVDEPGVAVVEVNNENCLMTLWPGQPFGNDLNKMPEPFAGELRGLWNTWLHKRYPDEAAMLAAWNNGIEPLGQSVIPPTQKWTNEQQGDAKCEIEPSPSTGTGFAPDVKITVPAIDGTDWHTQAHLVGLNLENGKTYTLDFEVRSPQPRALNVSIGLDQAPWSMVGGSQSIASTADWQKVRMTFVASGSVPDHARIAFAVGQSTIPIEIRNLQLRTGAPAIGLPAGESFAKSNITIPAHWSGDQKGDLAEFVVSVETHFADTMRNFLRHDLGVKSLIVVSQVQWGGVAGFDREAGSDLIDTHAYFEHPQFAAGEDWSAKHWTIGNTSQIKGMAQTGDYPLRDPAMYRVKGKPFTISEYDEPAPNDYAAEAIPMLGAVAATQDWDAVYTFAQATYGTAAHVDRITGFFDQTNHPAKVAFNPFAAVILRTAAVEPDSAVATLGLPKKAYRTYEYVGALWLAATKDTPIDWLTTRLNVVPEAIDGNKPLLQVMAGRRPPQVWLDTSKTKDGILVIDSPKAAGLIGFIGGQTASAGALEATFPLFDNNFAALTVHTLDDQPIATSKRALVTLVGRAENQGMGWNADRTSVGDQWGTGPVMCEGLTGTITLHRDQPAKVYALDVHGQRKSEIKTTFANGSLTFKVTPADATVWYEVAE